MEGIFLYNLKSDRYCLNCLLSAKSLQRWYKKNFPDSKLEKLCDGSYEIEDIVKDINNSGDWKVQKLFFDDFDIWDLDGNENIQFRS